MLGDLLGSADVEVQTTLGTYSKNLGELAAGGTPNPLVQLLKPKVTIRSGNLVLYQAAPAGDPSTAPPYGKLFLVAAVVGGAFLAMRLLRK